MICLIRSVPSDHPNMRSNHPTSNELIELIEPYIINQYKHLHNPIHTPKHKKMEKSRNPNTHIGGKKSEEKLRSIFARLKRPKMQTKLDFQH